MRTSIIVAIFALAGSTVAMAGERVQVDKIPQAVSDAVQKQLPNSKIESAERDSDDGKMKYELNVTHENAKYEFDVAEDGTILEFEKEGM